MATTTIEQRVPTGTWRLDPIHSTAGFEITHSEISTFRGGFGSIEARVEGGEEPILEGSVEVASIDIAEEQLKGHLLSPEFFDADRHPRVGFRSSDIRIDDGGEVEVRGSLEIAGTSREVAGRGRLAHLPASMDGSERIGLSLAATVDRSDFGMNWNVDLPSGGKALGYEVHVAVELELIREE
jgi:polyisoprenoid-binding protein YceI